MGRVKAKTAETEKSGRVNGRGAEGTNESSRRMVADLFPLKCKYTQPGHVFVVGSGDCGQLGLGPDVFEKEKFAPLRYFEDKQIVAVFAGGLHNIVLSADGKLYSWGCNDQLALGRSGEETEPAPVEGLGNEFIVDVACGDSISVALTREGRVYAWGTFRNSTGIFGYRKSVTTQATPLLITELQHIVSIACGSNHCIAVSAEGKTYSWGVGEQGQLGRKIIERHVYDSSLKPRAINFKPPGKAAKFVKAFCGSYHTFLLHGSQSLYAFGLNNYGQLGIGETYQEEAFDPQRVLELKEEDGIVDVVGGEHHSMVLTNKGHVYVFGRGDSGQLGLPDTETQSEPQLLKELSNIRQISCGASFSLAVSDAPTDNLWMWGYGEMGQLANGNEDREVPEQTEIRGRTVYCAAAGGQHTIVLLNPKTK